MTSAQLGVRTAELLKEFDRVAVWRYRSERAAKWHIEARNLGTVRDRRLGRPLRCFHAAADTLEEVFEKLARKLNGPAGRPDSPRDHSS